jgi:chromosome segregation ATPase
MTLDANGLAFILFAVVMALVMVVKWYPKINGIILKALGRMEAELDPPQEKPTIENLNARIDDLERQLTAADVRAMTLSEQAGRDKERLEGQLTSLQTQFDELKARYVKTEAEKAQIAQQRDAGLQKITQLLEENNNHLKTIKSLSDELNDVEIKVEALTVDSKARKSFENLIDELSSSFTRALIPALLLAVKDAIRATNEIKVLPTESQP